MWSHDQIKNHLLQCRGADKLSEKQEIVGKGVVKKRCDYGNNHSNTGLILAHLYGNMKPSYSYREKWKHYVVMLDTLNCVNYGCDSKYAQ